MNKNKRDMQAQINRSKALNKVRRSIASCDSISQLKSSYKMIDFFNNIYQNDVLTFKLAEAWGERLSQLRGYA